MTAQKNNRIRSVFLRSDNLAVNGLGFALMIMFLVLLTNNLTAQQGDALLPIPAVITLGITAVAGLTFRKTTVLDKDNQAIRQSWGLIWALVPISETPIAEFSRISMTGSYKSMERQENRRTNEYSTRYSGPGTQISIQLESRPDPNGIQHSLVLNHFT